MLPFLQFILAIGLLIGAAKVGGYLSSKLGQPAVAGVIMAGLILGPSVLNFLHWPAFTDAHLGETIAYFAELGVLLLLFIAGLDLHLTDLGKSGKSSVLAGSLGFVLTLGMGYLLATIFSYETKQALFIGLILAPTSIGISAQTLMELKVLRSKVGTTLLGAAAIDDTLGVLGVSLFLALYLGGVSSGFSSVIVIFLRMSLFLVFASAIGFWILPKTAIIIEKLPISQGLIAFTFITMLFYAWSAEVLGHMAAIIGAFLAGLFFARSSFKDKIERGFSSIAYGIFVPIFFINIGLSANVRQVPIGGLIFLAGMLVVVVISKLVGAGLGGRSGGMTIRESVQLGFGMIPRGEVVLIIAAIGIAEGLIDSIVFSTIVLLVIITSLITPPLLQMVFPPSKGSN
ncbi:MAG: cation:proton antiporter [Anaerolineales bacterium]